MRNTFELFRPTQLNGSHAIWGQHHLKRLVRKHEPSALRAPSPTRCLAPAVRDPLAGSSGATGRTGREAERHTSWVTDLLYAKHGWAFQVGIVPWVTPPYWTTTLKPSYASTSPLNLIPGGAVV